MDLGDPEARAPFRRAPCVAALKRRIEHDALGRAGEHRAIRVGRAGEGIDVGGQDRERPQRAALETGAQRLQHHGAVGAVERQRIDADEAVLAAIEGEDVERNGALDRRDEDLSPSNCHRSIGRFEIGAADRIEDDIGAVPAGRLPHPLGDVAIRGPEHRHLPGRVAAVSAGPALDAEDPRAGGGGDLGRGLTDLAVPAEHEDDVRPLDGARLAKTDIGGDERHPDGAGLRQADGRRLLPQAGRRDHEALRMAAVALNAEFAAGAPNFAADGSFGPSTTTPAKSRPGVRGQTACGMPPSIAFTSLGLTPELRTSTTAEPSGMVFGRSISTRRRTASSASGPDAFASTRTAREWVELFMVSLRGIEFRGGALAELVGCAVQRGFRVLAFPPCLNAGADFGSRSMFGQVEAALADRLSRARLVIPSKTPHFGAQESLVAPPRRDRSLQPSMSCPGTGVAVP